MHTFTFIIIDMQRCVNAGSHGIEIKIELHHLSISLHSVLMCTGLTYLYMITAAPVSRMNIPTDPQKAASISAVQERSGSGSEIYQARTFMSRHN